MSLRLIVALDFAVRDEAIALIDKLNPVSCALKVGSEMFTLFGANFIRLLVSKGFKVFLDLKFHDIPNTVARACTACAELGVWMINVHASGGLAMMQAAKQAIAPYGEQKPLLIAVTVLTSMSAEDLPAIGSAGSLINQVQLLARLTKAAGLDGVVCSAAEVPLIKQNCGSSFLTVTPGIRLPDDDINDQVRVFTPAQAIQQGSDYLVMGRSITGSANPELTVAKILTMCA